MSTYPTAERRIRVLETLIERRHEKIGVLAEEFQVCRSTISRDYQMLSVYHPLYSKFGKYGGIFVMDGYSLGRKYLSDEQATFLEELSPLLSEEQNKMMIGILKKFKQPVLENKRKLNS